jgi:SAM-dependent methyltransferase
MSDIRNVLRRPKVYEAFQNLVGAERLRDEIASSYIKAKPGDRILDIGCGTADIRQHLDDVVYVGFDPSRSYIETAITNYPDSTFHVGSIASPPVLAGAFDVVLAIGVLHHVGDREAIALFRLAKSRLRPNGRLLTVDPVLMPRRGNLRANFIVRNDRGQHVRNRDEYIQLAEEEFQQNVSSTIRSDLLRLPYNHCLLQCKS